MLTLAVSALAIAVAALIGVILLTIHVGKLTEIIDAYATYLLAAGPVPGSRTDPIAVAQLYGGDTPWIS